MKQTLFKILIIGALFSLACTTKVSEWVLLNSVPDQYLLVYFHKNEISETTKKQHSKMENEFKPANIVLKTMQRNEVEKPYYSLYFNNRLISDNIDISQLEKLTFSPFRKTVADELMKGKLCVMLYLKSGIAEKDEEGLKVVKNSVAASPFADVITVLDLDRNNKEESALVSFLLNIEDDLKEINEPMLFGVFGKFRALEPLLAKGISHENIKLMIDFLTADCSCLIKDDLPGSSILYKGKWENPQTALVNKILDANPQLEHH